jgi:hypothetical protein
MSGAATMVGTASRSASAAATSAPSIRRLASEPSASSSGQLVGAKASRSTPPSLARTPACRATASAITIEEMVAPATASIWSAHAPVRTTEIGSWSKRPASPATKASMSAEVAPVAMIGSCFSRTRAPLMTPARSTPTRMSNGLPE